MITRFGEEIPKEVLEALGNFHPAVRRLLFNRGVNTKEEAKDFLFPSFSSGVHDPFLLPDVLPAIERIRQAIDQNESIGIFADYDCDGIPGAVIANDFFEKLGYKNFFIYIPDRNLEGYGLNHKGIEELHANKVKLMITIDLGSVSISEIEFAKSLGIDVIVTDHHLPDEVEPDCIAFVNPKAKKSEYPFKELCGSGVFWKLVSAFLERYRDDFAVAKGWEKWLLDMVGIATVSDQVPLVGENRVLALFGLVVLRKTPRSGLRALAQEARVNLEKLTEQDIAFSFAPRLNASGRMAHPEIAFKLLIEKDRFEATRRAKELEALNRQRKTKVAQAMKKAHLKIKEHDLLKHPVLFVGDRDFSLGILGLIASKLLEEFKRPVFVWGTYDSLTLKGSCRSDGTCNLVEVMRQMPSELFVGLGGHKGAGGFSLTPDNLHLFYPALVDSYEKNKEELVEESEDRSFETEIELKDITASFIEDISRLGPFGMGNQEPVFYLSGVTVLKVSSFGKAGEHQKLILSDGTNSREAISFFKKDERVKDGDEISLTVILEATPFSDTPRMRMKSIFIS